MKSNYITAELLDGELEIIRIKLDMSEEDLIESLKGYIKFKTKTI